MARKKGSEKPKGFYKQGGRVKPITEKKGIKESDMRISVKGNNDRIRVVGKEEFDKDVKKGTGFNVNVSSPNDTNNQNISIKKIANDWNNLTPEQKEIAFGDIWQYYSDKESTFAQYNYGNTTWDNLPERFKIQYIKKMEKQEEWHQALIKQNKERMDKISPASRAKVWEAMGGEKDINSLNFEDSRKLWMEHGKYPYANLRFIR